MTKLLRALPLLLLTAPLTAQMPADDVLRDFEPVSTFQFSLDGRVLPDAEILLSERAVAYLILAPELSSPVMIQPRAQTVESVHLMKVARQGDGTIDLLADASLEPLGGFTVDGRTQEVRFELDGRPAKLMPKPPAVGLHTADSLVDHSRSYSFKAKAYEPAASALSSLRDETRDVRVRVYFGSWCPVCGRLVPNVLRVQEELAGSSISFEYYGLPNQMRDDPITEKDDIHGVPTAIVYVGGEEAARLSGKDLASPEKALLGVLGG